MLVNIKLMTYVDNKPILVGYGQLDIEKEGQSLNGFLPNNLIYNNRCFVYWFSETQKVNKVKVYIEVASKVIPEVFPLLVTL